MYRYAPQFFELQNLLHYHIGIHQYALVCTGMHRSSLKYKIYYITTNRYAPVCTGMHRSFLNYKIYYIHYHKSVCTSMYRYAPQFFEVQNLLHYHKLV